MDIINNSKECETTQELEVGLGKWMKEKFKQAPNRRNMSLYVNTQEYKDIFKQVQLINQILAKESTDLVGVMGFKIRDYVLDQILEGKNDTMLAQTIDKWTRENRVLDMSDLLWIMQKWKRLLLTEMQGMEAAEIKKNRKYGWNRQSKAVGMHHGQR